MIMDSWKFNEGYQTICDAARVARDPRIGSAVLILSIARTGISFDVDRVSESLAELSEEHGVSPDAINMALLTHDDYRSHSEETDGAFDV